jgi:hypothetical protein
MSSTASAGFSNRYWPDEQDEEEGLHKSESKKILEKLSGIQPPEKMTKKIELKDVSTSSIFRSIYFWNHLLSVN